MRKTLCRHASKHSGLGQPLFSTRNNNGKVPVSILERDLKTLGERLGIKGLHPPRLRQSFSVSYLRSGANLEYLRWILGDSSILTTQRHLQSLGVSDI